MITNFFNPFAPKSNAEPVGGATSGKRKFGDTEAPLPGVQDTPIPLFPILCQGGFKNWEMPKRGADFEPGAAGTDEAQPEKLGDADRSQKRRHLDAGRTNFRITCSIGRLYSKIFSCKADIGCIGCVWIDGKIFHVIKPIRINRTNKNHYTLEDKVATTIQKYTRGYLARKSHLASHLYTQYQDHCNRVKGPQGHLIPRASGGHTRVYIPQEMPDIVLKKSGRRAAIKRFHQMQDVRAILNSQKSSHLIIPKANLCQDFLVEQRLPINVDPYHNMGLYISQPKLFDDAVRELVRLFSKRELTDLITDGHVRYDNLPLYIVEENGQYKGKIGLIDLERIGSRSKGLETLVRIFPFHLDVIQDEARKLKWDFDEELLKAAAEEGTTYLQEEFINHLEFLKQKSASPYLSPQPFQVSSKRAEELIISVENELLNLNQGISDLFTRRGYRKIPKNFLNEDSEKIAKELAVKITPLIINNIKAQIKAHSDPQLNMLSARDMTESQLIRFRSHLVDLPALYKGVGEMISQNLRRDFDDGDFGQFGNRFIPEQLVYVIIGGLIKSGDIFHFNFGWEYPRIRY